MPYKNKEDQLASQRRHYANNTQQYLDKNAKKRQLLKDAVYKYKEENPCSDCGGFFPACAMDFDHIEDNKVRSVSTLVGSGSISATWAEIEKCELVCAVCHRIRTRDRLRSGIV